MDGVVNAPLKVNLLIVDNDGAEVNTIKSWLEQEMRVPWGFTHCVNIKEASLRISNVDLVILKPEMEGFLSPKEVFKTIGNMFFEIPVLVITNEGDDHQLSTYVMEQGAADTVIRGQFSRLVDAIEFALIRQKLKTDVRETSDKILTDSRHENAVHNEKQRQILRMLGGDYAVDQISRTKKKTIN